MAELKLEHIVSSPIEEGDAGIVIKSTGAIKVFTTGHIDPKNLTEAQLIQGEKLRVIIQVLEDEELYDQAIAKIAEAEARGDHLMPSSRH